MRKLKLQRYRKYKEEWLIWLLFQSFAQRCGSGVNSNAYIAVGKQSCNGKYTNEYIF